MFAPKVKSHDINTHWIFLGRGQVGEGTAYAKALRELGLLEEGQVAQYVQDWRVVRRQVGWVNGGLVRKGFESKECGLMWKGSC